MAEFCRGFHRVGGRGHKVPCLWYVNSRRNRNLLVNNNEDHQEVNIKTFKSSYLCMGFKTKSSLTHNPLDSKPWTGEVGKQLWAGSGGGGAHI